MKTKTLGIVIIIIGALMMIYTGFTYVTTKNVVDLGSIQINKEESHPVQWSPIAGLAFMTGGVLLVVFGKKK